MGEDLVQQPILHPPADEPDRHWKTVGDETINEIVDARRRASQLFPTRQAAMETQTAIDFSDSADGREGIGRLDALREDLRQWRQGGYECTTRATRIFLDHLASGKERERSHNLFFAQREAVETVVFLTECCPSDHPVLNFLNLVADEYNSGLMRLALRMATGTGKTAVMACLIAWYAINRRTVRDYGKGLSQNVDRIIIVCPGRTVRERLQVLDPRRPDNIYDAWQLLPDSLRPRLNGIRVHIVNFERLQPRNGIDRADIEVAKRGMAATRLNTVLGLAKGDGRETHSEMWSRILRLDLRQTRERVVVLNDEAHHCWHRLEGDVPGVWMEALQSLRTHPLVQLSQVIDLTATPIFIDPRKSRGYSAQQTQDGLFPWVVSEYALAESMESGLVKIPRLPTVGGGGNFAGLRNLYENTGGKPLSKPVALQPVQDAAELLYGDYKRTFERWKQQNDPNLGEPVFIAVVNTKANAEILFRTLGGQRDSKGQLIAPSGFDLLANVPWSGCSDEECAMRTIMVVSKSASPETAEAGFEVSNKTSQLGIRPADAAIPKDEEVQEVLQTVGQPGKKGESVRCVVSVGMLTEGWDCQRVTHILGYRKFGSQLLCEQVLGRALRRQDYDNRAQMRRKDTGLVNERYPAEYATVIGVPFQTWSPVGDVEPPVVPPQPIKDVFPIESRAERFAIWVPAIEDYRLVIPPCQLDLRNDAIDSKILGRPDGFLESFDSARVIGPVGQGEDLQRNVQAMPGHGVWKLAAELAEKLANAESSDEDMGVRHRSSLLFSECLKIAKIWLADAQQRGWSDKLILESVAARRTVADALLPAISSIQPSEVRRTGIPIDPKHPLLSASRWNRFKTRLKDVEELGRSELNVAACHSRLEARIALQLDRSGMVAAITRNHGPQRIEIPYRHQGAVTRYVPDFFLRLNSGESGITPHVVLEVKGMPDDMSERKKAWTREWWIPAANELGREYGQSWIHVEVGPGQDVEDQISIELKGAGLA